MSEHVKRTPLYEEHRALGARMVTFAGYEMPVRYSDIVEEHNAVRTSAGVFDVSHMAQFRVFGFGVPQFLQGVLTNDVARISEIGAAQYTLACDESGGIIDDLIVYHTGELEYLIIGNAANRAGVLDWLRAQASRHGAVVEGVEEEHRPGQGLIELADESDRTALIALQGPRALDVLAELAGSGYSAPPRFTLAEAVVDTVPALVARTGYTGEDGVEIVCHASHAAALWRAILSFAEVTPCGLGARDTLRLEMGYRLYGSDIDRSVDPVSAGLSWAVSKDKGPFVGSEAIAAIRARGPVMRLAGLVVDEGVPRPGYSVLRDGGEVGKVASGTFSPTLGHGIATAYLPAALAAPGTEVEISMRRKSVNARVEELPFLKRTSLS